MSKKLLLLLFVPILLYSAELTHTYTFNNLRVNDGVACLEGCRTSRQLFSPMVPVKSVYLLLPKDHEAVSFNIQYSDVQTLTGKHYLRPALPSVDINKGPYLGPDSYQFPVYKENKFFPHSVRSNWFRIQYKNGNAIFLTSLNPVQWNPITGQLRYAKNITINVQTTMKKRAGTAPYVCNSFVKGQLRMLVDNKKAITELPETMKDPDDYEYLIITYDGIKNNWNSFVEFNERRCMRSKIETIQNIRANVSGADDQDKMRNFIKAEYQAHKIVYVMLGGDVTSNANNIGYRKFCAKFYDHHISPDRYNDKKNLAAEMYYSCLDGDWKGSNSTYGQPGTEDMFWDVYACRFPVASSTELNNVINKTIKYSESPVKNEVTNIFLVGNYLWTHSGVEVYGADHMDEFMGTCNRNNYTTHGFPKNIWKTSELNDRDNNGWSISTFRSRVDSFKPTWIEHLGHGNTTYAFNETNSGITNSNYRNDGTNANYFIVTTGACYPGNFPSNDCLMEKFLLIKNGAVASQGFMDSGLEDDDGTDGVGQRIRRYFHDAIFNPSKRVHYLEMASGLSKEVNAEIVVNPNIETPPYFGALRFIAYQLNFLGDPALSFWTDTPKEWTALPDPKVGANEFTMKTPPYTWIALCDANDKIITTQLTGYTYDADVSFTVSDSTCKINDDIYKNYVKDNPGKKLKVRMKAHNYLPFEAEVDIPNTGIIANKELQNLSFKNYLGSMGIIIRVNYNLVNRDHVNISLYNSKGVLVKTLVNGIQQAGNNHVDMSTSEVRNGIYYCKLTTKNFQKTRKLVVTK